MVVRLIPTEPRVGYASIQADSLPGMESLGPSRTQLVGSYAFYLGVGVLLSWLILPVPLAIACTLGGLVAPSVALYLRHDQVTVLEHGVLSARTQTKVAPSSAARRSGLVRLRSRGPDRGVVPGYAPTRHCVGGRHYGHRP